jgi:hypothetical protein
MIFSGLSTAASEGGNSEVSYQLAQMLGEGERMRLKSRKQTSKDNQSGSLLQFIYLFIVVFGFDC